MLTSWRRKSNPLWTRDGLSVSFISRLIHFFFSAPNSHCNILSDCFSSCNDQQIFWEPGTWISSVQTLTTALTFSSESEKLHLLLQLCCQALWPHLICRSCTINSMLFSFLHYFDMIARTLNCFWLIDLMIHILLEERAMCRLSFTALYLQMLVE